MPATKIMVIRHANKPESAGGPLGVTEMGEEDKQSLIVRGWQRAGALAVFFSPLNGRLASLGLALPDTIFASDDQKHPAPAGGGKQGSRSKHPLETVTPLAAKLLGRKPDTSYWKGEVAALAAAAMASNGAVLICWDHREIPAIANAIVPQPNAIPQAWPDDRFDMIWVFDPPAAPGQPWSFAQVPQNLLAGDIDGPIQAE